MPGPAAVGAMVVPFAYYLLMLVPTGEEYHDLHQGGMLVALPLGYLVGLVMSFGARGRTGSPRLDRPRG